MENKIVLSLANGIKIECVDEETAVRMVARLSGASIENSHSKERQDKGYKTKVKDNLPKRHYKTSRKYKTVGKNEIEFVLSNKHMKISELARSSMFKHVSYKRARSIVCAILGKTKKPEYLSEIMKGINEKQEDSSPTSIL